MTLAASQPFTPQDQSLGVAYISVILVWCFLTMFPFGGWMLVKRDFDRPLVRDDIEESAQGTGVKWITRMKQIAKRTATSRVSCINPDRRSSSSSTAESVVVEDKDTKHIPRESVVGALQVQRPQSSSSSCEMEVIRPVRSHQSHHTAQPHEETELQDLSLAATPSLSRHRNLTTPTPLEPLYKRIAKSVFKFLLSLVSPPAISCVLSLLIALIPTLKALFVADVPGVNMPDAPDGMPPLEWILDIATFGGTPFSPRDAHSRWRICPDGFDRFGSLTINLELPPWTSALVINYWIKT
jgi:auxin efflux carrier family protein